MENINSEPTELNQSSTDIDWSMLNRLADMLYETAKKSGFHENETVHMGNYCSNLHAEVSELWEAYREQALEKPCDKAAKMEEYLGESLTASQEETADILIRTLDTAKALGIDIGRAVRIKDAYNKTRAYRHGNKIA